MTKINTLTINGASYQLEDPAAARKPLLITIDEWHKTASHSCLEIFEHLDGNGYVFAVVDGSEIAALTGAYSHDYIVTFQIPADENGVWKTYTIDATKAVTIKEMSFATAEQIGDIETALDGIIAIQNNLIGGDA